jgi:ABC-2 type transport system ATP-binding protein
VTVLLTTHELADVERLADRITIIDRGRIVAVGTLAELAAGAAPRIRFHLATGLSEADRAALQTELERGMAEAGQPGPVEVRLVDDGGLGRYRAEGIEPSPRLVAILAGWAAERGLLLVGLRTSGASLEERYLELTGERGENEA